MGGGGYWGDNNRNRADHSKRPILKTEPGDSEPGWGSSPQWSGPPLSPPRPWTNTKDHYNSNISHIRQKIITLNLRWPVQSAPPCLRDPSRPDCPLSDLKVNNLFWVNIGGWWKSKSSNTTVATRPQFPSSPSVPPCRNLFLPIFTLSEPFVVSGPTEHCSIFHFPSSVRPFVRHRRDISTFLDILTVYTMKTIYFLNAYHLGW